MIRPLLFVLLLSMFAVPLTHAEESLTRRDGFLLLWQSLQRPADSVRETPYSDVPQGSVGFVEITYAKSRGILRDATEFYPDEPLLQTDALLMLFRTRNIEPFATDGESRRLMETVEPEDIPLLAKHYALPITEGAVSRDELMTLMQSLDTKLKNEEHEVSLYSEKFHGKGTAFGETFDMHAMTAAHRSFPANTLVKVTNLRNSKSVVVRINDRGPFVQGRDMDLSLGAFLAIEDRSKGIAMATFERLGDATVVERCEDNRMQRRITRDVRVDPGVPHRLPLGQTLVLRSSSPFVVRDVVYPDGVRLGTHVWLTDTEAYEFTPSSTGLYRFLMGTKEGRVREMRTEVVDCSG